MDMEKVISDIEQQIRWIEEIECHKFPGWLNVTNAMRVAIALLKKQEAVVHPEPSCEMTYITNCCCDLCGVQLIREDNFCRCCGKPIDWSK